MPLNLAIFIGTHVVKLCLNYTFALMFFAGKAKFELPHDTVAADDDGTAFEEDEVLQGLEAGTILLILKTGEIWMSSCATF